MARVLFRRTSRGARFERYFGFLEERAGPGALPSAPSGGLPPAGFPWPEPPPRHWRFSVVHRRQFLELARAVDAIPVAGATPDQRRRRREQLDILFATLRPETLDLFPKAKPDSAALTTAYRLGGWFSLAIHPMVTPDDEVVGLIGGLDVEDRPVGLTYFARVARSEHRVLRKVFSLAHIGSIDQGPGGGFVPEGLPPLAPQKLHLKRRPPSKAEIPCVVRFAPRADAKAPGGFGQERQMDSAEEAPAQHIRLTWS